MERDKKAQELYGKDYAALNETQQKEVRTQLALEKLSSSDDWDD